MLDFELEEQKNFEFDNQKDSDSNTTSLRAYIIIFALAIWLIISIILIITQWR